MDYWQMDYCSSCRRHLNRALVCPGCGAYAPDIAPEPHAHEEPEPAYAAPVPDAAPETAVIPLRDGRAARRRQRIRWKKSQRRALVATAVALIGGGLTLQTVGRGAPTDRAQTAAAPDELTLDTPQGHPAERIAPPETRPEERRTAPGTSATPSRDDRSTAGRSQQRPASPAPQGGQSQAPVSVPSAPRPPQHRSDSPDVPSDPVATPTAPQPTTPPPADASPAPTDPAAPPPAPPESTPPQLCLLVICLG
ncbi:SCO2400 family protein [Streptomyces sp. NPDC002309]